MRMGKTEQQTEQLFKEQSSIETPPSGFVSTYVKTDGKLYFKDDVGTETQAGGGGGALTSSTKTDNYSVTTADAGTLLIMNSSAEKTFSLPSVSASDIGCHFYFAKINSGKLIIDAADSDKIADSAAGATIYNDQSGETYAAIHLILVSETQWSIFGLDGTWTTT